jgi:hypothetical protein
MVGQAGTEAGVSGMLNSTEGMEVLTQQKECITTIAIQLF